MSSLATLKRQLKIKTGSLNRLSKDHQMYTKEAEDQRVKLDELIGGNGEEWYIKNARKMLDESHKMIQRGQVQRAGAYNDLVELITAAESEPEITEDDPDLKAAKEAIANADATPSSDS